MKLRHKKVLKQTKGFKGRIKNNYTLSRRVLTRSLQVKYKARRLKKRIFRQKWINLISNYLIIYDLKYSQFIYALKLNSIKLNRKILYELIKTEPKSFFTLINFIKKIA